MHAQQPATSQQKHAGSEVVVFMIIAYITIAACNVTVRYYVYSDYYRICL
jgi:hypothetical protein